MSRNHSSDPSALDVLLRGIVTACDNATSPGDEDNVRTAIIVLLDAWDELKPHPGGLNLRPIPEALCRLGHYAIHRGFADAFTRCIHALKQIAVECHRLPSPPVRAAVIAALIRDLGVTGQRRNPPVSAMTALNALISLYLAEARSRNLLGFYTLHLASTVYRINPDALHELTDIVRRNMKPKDLDQSCRYASDGYPTEALVIETFMRDSGLPRSD